MAAHLAYYEAPDEPRAQLQLRAEHFREVVHRSAWVDNFYVNIVRYLLCQDPCPALSNVSGQTTP
jgi:hypothetical protein